MTSETPSTELKTYEGSCHCGAYKYHVKVPDISETGVVVCNCSICFRKNYVWLFPQPGNFVVDEGEGKLVEYKFGAGKMSHKV